MRVISFCWAWLILSTVAGWGTETAYDLASTNSRIEIRLGTAGVLGGLGHEHLIQAPIQKGMFVYRSDDVERSSVNVEVDAKALRVVDPELSVEERGKVQATMESDRVLDVKRYSAISFKSTSVEPKGKGHLLVQGNLTIRGKTRPVLVEVTLEETEPGLRAAGRTRFKQTEFDIKPVTAGMGSVRTKDEMTITFQIAGSPKRGR